MHRNCKLWETTTIWCHVWLQKWLSSEWRYNECHIYLTFIYHLLCFCSWQTFIECVDFLFLLSSVYYSRMEWFAWHWITRRDCFFLDAVCFVCNKYIISYHVKISFFLLRKFLFAKHITTYITCDTALLDLLHHWQCNTYSSYNMVQYSIYLQYNTLHHLLTK